MTFGARLGDHLRRVRRQKGLSLLDVEQASDKEFKASVLGAYERGERAISVERLARLAEVYHVPASALLPADAEAERAAPGAGTQSIALSLPRLRSSDASESRVLRNYVAAVRRARRDWGGEVFTMRGSDVLAVAAALDRPVADLVRRIEELGLRVSGGSAP